MLKGDLGRSRGTRTPNPRFWRSRRLVPSHYIVSRTVRICWLPRCSLCHAVLRNPSLFRGVWVQTWVQEVQRRAFDVLVITSTCPTRIAWHKPTSNTGMVMRKLFIFSAVVFALVTGATATVVATTLQSQSAVADTTH
jgi:hypothetical protein